MPQIQLMLNRQYSYSPTSGRVGLDHECEAHAGTFYEKTAAEFAEFKENF